MILLFWLLLLRFGIIECSHLKSNRRLLAAVVVDVELNETKEDCELTCPITLLPIVEPFRSKYCDGKIIFEKSAIEEYIHRNGGTAVCPLTRTPITIDSFELDIQLQQQIKQQGMNFFFILL